MDYEVIINLIIKILAGVLVSLLSLAANKFRVWLSKKVDSTQLSTIESYISRFCEAADQLFKESDPSGTIRKQYVVDRLKELAVEVTPVINALIESYVFNLHYNDRRNSDFGLPLCDVDNEVQLCSDTIESE